MNTERPAHTDTIAKQAREFAESKVFSDVVAGYMAPTNASKPVSKINMVIHPNDQMLDHSLKHFNSVGTALSQYFGVALQQHRSAQQILSLFHPDLSQVKVLDFACGYGRMLRLLSNSLSPKQIWAADIQHDAVDFVSTQFGVNPLYSGSDPEQFNPPQRFDFIWVASLFSHLPEALFHGWLVKLTSLLTDNGVLCFSVHDEALLSPGQTMPQSGIAFAAHSENKDLDQEEYGTSHVTEAYVAAVVERAMGASHPYFRIPRGLAYQQDLYAVPKTATRDLSVLKNFRWGPWGWVDERRLFTHGNLDLIRLCGWATSFDASPIEHIHISQGGIHTTVPLSVLRTDVEGVFHDPRLRDSGWEVTLAHFVESAKAQSFIEISAVCADGTRALLYAGLMAEPATAA